MKLSGPHARTCFPKLQYFIQNQLMFQIHFLIMPKVLIESLSGKTK
jgi:hypothetical protein